MTKQLKEEQPMEWIGLINNIQACAREIVKGQSQILCKLQNVVQIEQNNFRRERRKLLPPCLLGDMVSVITSSPVGFNCSPRP